MPFEPDQEPEPESQSVAVNGLIRTMRAESPALDIEDDETTPLDMDEEDSVGPEVFDTLEDDEPEEPAASVPEGNGLYAESVDQFLAEAGKHRILKAAEEVVLAKTMEKGRDAQRRLEELESAGEPTEELRIELEKLKKAGIDAKEELMKCNLKLVVSIVKHHTNNGVTLGELIDEGVTGLSRAADKFDWRRGFKFSTYATWWIRQSAQRAVANQGRTIRVPVHVVERINRIRRAEYELTAELMRQPTEEELAEQAKLPLDQVREALQAVRQQPTSLNIRVGKVDDTEYGDVINPKVSEAEITPSVEEEAETEFVRHTLRQAMDRHLSKRERQIIELRFGFTEDGESKTLEEIGKTFGITRERVRQLENIALKRLRESNILQDIT